MEPTVSMLARESDQVLGSFLRGQLTVMVCLGVLYSIGLWLAGLEWPLAIGMLAGLVSFVPYLGVIFGLLTASIAVLIQSQELLQLVWVLLVFGTGQTLEGMVLTPWLVGDRVGLHPVAVIFAVLAGGQLFGFMGILLALPVASVLAVMLRHARERYRESEFYGEADEIGEK
jgi:predicted PurR-regulated permease PerM